MTFHNVIDVSSNAAHSLRLYEGRCESTLCNKGYRDVMWLRRPACEGDIHVRVLAKQKDVEDDFTAALDQDAGHTPPHRMRLRNALVLWPLPNDLL